ATGGSAAGWRDGRGGSRQRWNSPFSALPMPSIGLAGAPDFAGSAAALVVVDPVLPSATSHAPVPVLAPTCARIDSPSTESPPVPIAAPIRAIAVADATASTLTVGAV